MQRSPTPTRRERKRAAKIHDEELRGRFIARIGKLLATPEAAREQDLGEWTSYERAAVALSIGFPGRTDEQYANGALALAGLVTAHPTLSEAEVVEALLDLTDNPVGALLYYNLPEAMRALLVPFLSPAPPDIARGGMGRGLTLTDLGLAHLKVPWPEGFEIEPAPPDSDPDIAEEIGPGS
jgi:hypothetical protein